AAARALRRPARRPRRALRARARAALRAHDGGGRLALRRAAQLLAEPGDLEDGGGDPRVARGDDLLVEVGHVRAVVPQRSGHGDGALAVEELEVVLDVD